MFWQYCTYHGKCYLRVSMCIFGSTCTYHGKCLFVCEHVYFGSTVLTMVNVYLCVSMCILAVLYLPW